MTTQPNANPSPAAARKLKEAATKVHDTADNARAKVATAYETTKRRAASAGKRAADGVEHNALAVLVGGLAIGAIAGAMLPRTKREAAALGGVGKRLRGAASEAAKAAKRAGVETFDTLGINGEAARTQAKKLIDSALSAATNAGEAAVKTARSATRKQD